MVLTIPGLVIISIHAPVKGATACPRRTTPPSSDFNPRSREGSDEYQESTRTTRQYFNPRSREGSDDMH